MPKHPRPLRNARWPVMAAFRRPLGPAAAHFRGTRTAEAHREVRVEAEPVLPRGPAMPLEFPSAPRRFQVRRTALPPTNLGPIRPRRPLSAATITSRPVEYGRNRFVSSAPPGNRRLRSTAVLPIPTVPATKAGATTTPPARRDAPFPRSPPRIIPRLPHDAPAAGLQRGLEAVLVDQAPAALVPAGAPKSRRSVPRNAIVPTNSAR